MPLRASAGRGSTYGRAFIERGREGRRQFRFNVAPEDLVETSDLRGFTRDLMRQMKNDLGTKLDRAAVVLQRRRNLARPADCRGQRTALAEAAFGQEAPVVLWMCQGEFARCTKEKRYLRLS